MKLISGKKVLLFATYHSTHHKYGVSDTDYIEDSSFALNVYASYDKFLLAGDFSKKDDETLLDDFLNEFKAKNLVKENTCFNNIDNPSCIDLYITNAPLSFQNSTTVSTGLSDFHKMIVTVIKTTFPKEKPQTLVYRDYKNFIESDYRNDQRISPCAEQKENFKG